MTLQIGVIGREHMLKCRPKYSDVYVYVYVLFLFGVVFGSTLFILKWEQLPLNSLTQLSGMLMHQYLGSS